MKPLVLHRVPDGTLLCWGFRTMGFSIRLLHYLQSLRVLVWLKTHFFDPKGPKYLYIYIYIYRVFRVSVLES